MLAGQTSGALNETTPNNGGLDFAVIKLTEAGVEEWSWQVTKGRSEPILPGNISNNGESIWCRWQCRSASELS